MNGLSLIAIVGIVLLCGLAVFQVLLALGRPLGEMAWGGRHRVLPRKLRRASVVAVPVLLWAAYILAARAHILPAILSPDWIRGFTWFFTGYFGLNVLANLASRSPKEKWIMGPLSLVLFLACLLTALP